MMSIPNQSQFIDAYLAGLPHAGFLRCLHQLESWYDLPGSEAVAAMQQHTTDARLLYQAGIVLGFKLQREMGIPVDASAPVRLQQLLTATAEGRASTRESQFVTRVGMLWQLGAALLKVDPTLNQPVSPADQAKAELQGAANAIFERLTSRPLGDPGTASPESILEVETILQDFAALVAKTPADNAALPDVFYGMGHAALVLARNLITAGRNEEARINFEKSSGYFARAGQPEKATAIRAQLQAFERRLAGQLDDTAAESLQTLIEPAPPANPWARIESLMNLATVAGNAFDVFEALSQAESAAVLLAGLGYADPGKTGTKAAITAWVSTATATLTGTELFRQFSQVGTWYLSILSARFAEVIREDRVAADLIQATQVETEKVMSRLQDEAARAATAQEQEWQAYFPPPASSSAKKTATVEPSFEDLMDRARAVDAALESVRDRCNERIGTGVPMNDLLAELKSIEAEGDELRKPIYEAKTRLEQVYVLGHLGRAAEMIPLARAARDRLLAKREPRLGSFTQSAERVIYLLTWSSEINAYLMLQDSANGLEACEAVMRDFEIERYRTNSPYRQSAVLGSVAEFYKWATFFAFKLKRWDQMLEAIELIKARSAIRTRLQIPPVPAVPSDEIEQLTREFETTTAALARAPGDPELQLRRRQLWDLLAITRGRAGSSVDLPEFTLASLQAGLADDEALVGYFWLAEATVLTVAVDRDRFHAERINLQPKEVSRLNNFVDFVRQLTSSSGNGLDREIKRLGELLLPSFLRDFISEKKRLIISPHHGLHLFPFHAVPWAENEFVATRFAVRYVPNFSSLLLPWKNRSEDQILALAVGNFADPAVTPLHNVENDSDIIRWVYETQGTFVEQLQGPRASVESFRELKRSGALAKFRCLHFGTHGLSVFSTPNEPLDARLLLQDGALDCMDLAGLSLNAELAVVSTCYSGQRALAVREMGELPGDDIFGLQSALFQAGVRCILGTLWLVETDSSSAITVAFHRHYAVTGESDLALQRAIADYLADPRTEKGAFYWAPYFISCLGAAEDRDRPDASTKGLPVSHT